MALGISLFDWPVFGERQFLGIDNYTHLLNDPVFRRVVLNTALFVVLYVPLNVVLSLGLAVWLGPQIRGRQAFRVVFFMPVVTPMVANVIVWRMIYQPNGVIDSGMYAGTGVTAPNFLGFELGDVVDRRDDASGRGSATTSWSSPPRSTHPAGSPGVGADRRRRTVAAVPTSSWPMITPSMFFATTMTLITSFQVFTGRS